MITTTFLIALGIVVLFGVLIYGAYVRIKRGIRKARDSARDAVARISHW